MSLQNAFFSKITADGNDFILIDTPEQFPNPSDFLSQLSRSVCNRNFGIGADGLVILNRLDAYSCEMAIYNSDGSRAEMCGNALRSIATYWDDQVGSFNCINIATDAGMRSVYHINNAYQVDLGKPQLVEADREYLFKGCHLLGDIVKIGNPHFVIHCGYQEFDLSVIGPFFEHHPDFPEGINVELVKTPEGQGLGVSVWERGVGLSYSCGTGGAAAFFSALLKGTCTNPCPVRLLGGDLLYEQGEDGSISFQGKSRIICSGEIKNIRGLKWN